MSDFCRSIGGEPVDGKCMYNGKEYGYMDDFEVDVVNMNNSYKIRTRKTKEEVIKSLLEKGFYILPEKRIAQLVRKLKVNGCDVFIYFPKEYNGVFSIRLRSRSEDEERRCLKKLMGALKKSWIKPDKKSYMIALKLSDDFKKKYGKIYDMLVYSDFMLSLGDRGTEAEADVGDGRYVRLRILSDRLVVFVNDMEDFLRFVDVFTNKILA